MTIYQNKPRRKLLHTGLPVFLLALIFQLLPGLAWACDCMNPGLPDDELKKYDLVFMGKVVESDEDARLARLTVKKTWKGDLLKTVELPSDYTGCGFYFETGRRYLVYASKVENGFTTDSCTPTKREDWARGDILFLDDVAKGEDRKIILKRLIPLIRSHKNSKVREGVVRFLRDVPNDQDPPETLKILVSAMSDPSSNVRGAATFTLYVKSYYKNKAVTEAMIKGLQDENIFVRFYAANALSAAGWHFRENNPSLRNRVTKALKHSLKTKGTNVAEDFGSKITRRRFEKSYIEVFERAIRNWEVP